MNGRPGAPGRPALGGMALFWAGDTLAVRLALAAFGLLMNGAALIVFHLVAFGVLGGFPGPCTWIAGHWGRTAAASPTTGRIAGRGGPGRIVPALLL